MTRRRLTAIRCAMHTPSATSSVAAACMGAASTSSEGPSGARCPSQFASFASNCQQCGFSLQKHTLPWKAVRDVIVLVLSAVGLVLSYRQLSEDWAWSPKLEGSEALPRVATLAAARYIGCFSSKTWFSGRTPIDWDGSLENAINHANHKGRRYVALARRGVAGDALIFDAFSLDTTAFTRGDLVGGGCEKSCADDPDSSCGCADCGPTNQAARRWAVYDLSQSVDNGDRHKNPVAPQSELVWEDLFGLDHCDEAGTNDGVSTCEECASFWDLRCELQAEDLVFQDAKVSYLDQLGF